MSYPSFEEDLGAYLNWPWNWIMITFYVGLYLILLPCLSLWDYFNAPEQL